MSLFWWRDHRKAVEAAARLGDFHARNKVKQMEENAHITLRYLIVTLGTCALVAGIIIAVIMHTERENELDIVRAKQAASWKCTLSPAVEQ